MVRGERGFTLLWVLFLVVLLGIGLTALSQVWETEARREKEAQLLFVGNQFRRAIESYRDASPGPTRQYPARLTDLLADPRFPNIVRHLRKIYRDPITNGTDWGLVKRGDGIVGVYSLADKRPLKTGSFPKADAEFAGQDSYRGWRFVAPMEATPKKPASGTATAQSKATPASPSNAATTAAQPIDNEE